MGRGRRRQVLPRCTHTQDGDRGKGGGGNGWWAGAGGKPYLPYTHTHTGRGEGGDNGRWEGAGGRGRVTASYYINYKFTFQDSLADKKTKMASHINICSQGQVNVC